VCGDSVYWIDERWGEQGANFRSVHELLRCDVSNCLRGCSVSEIGLKLCGGTTTLTSVYSRKWHLSRDMQKEGKARMLMDCPQLRWETPAFFPCPCSAESCPMEAMLIEACWEDEWAPA